MKAKVRCEKGRVSTDFRCEANQLNEELTFIRESHTTFTTQTPFVPDVLGTGRINGPSLGTSCTFPVIKGQGWQTTYLDALLFF